MCFYLFIYLFVSSGGEGVKSQIPGTYSRLGLAAVRVIEEHDRNVLIRSPNAVGKEVRRGKERRGDIEENGEKFGSF